MRVVEFHNRKSEGNPTIPAEITCGEIVPRSRNAAKCNIPIVFL